MFIIFHPEIQLLDMYPTEIYIYEGVQIYKYNVVHSSFVSEGETLDATQIFISRILLK